MDDTAVKDTPTGDEVATLHEIERIEQLFFRFHLGGESGRWEEFARLLSEDVRS